MKISVTSDKTFQTTVKEFEKREGVDYPTASNFLKLLVAAGAAKIVGERRASGSGKGKPSAVYEVTLSVSLQLEEPKQAALPMAKPSPSAA